MVFRIKQVYLFNQYSQKASIYRFSKEQKPILETSHNVTLLYVLHGFWYPPVTSYMPPAVTGQISCFGGGMLLSPVYMPSPNQFVLLISATTSIKLVGSCDTVSIPKFLLRVGKFSHTLRYVVGAYLPRILICTPSTNLPAPNLKHYNHPKSNNAFQHASPTNLLLRLIIWLFCIR